jgi:hypothetical protein
VISIPNHPSGAISNVGGLIVQLSIAILTEKIFPQTAKMKIDEILETLKTFHVPYPKAAMEAAIEKRIEITPELLKILSYTAENVDAVIENDEWSYSYAFYLFAQFREKQAYPLVMRILSMPEEDLDYLFGDYDGLESVMASVSGGDPSLIKKLIENRQADEYIRGHAIYALVTLYFADELSREKLIEYFATLFTKRLEKKPGAVWDTLVDVCLDIHADELHDHIIKAYDADLVWEGEITRQDIKVAFEKDKNEVLAYLKKTERFKLITSAVKAMEWWACFHEDPNDFDHEAYESELIDEYLDILAGNMSDEEKAKRRKAYDAIEDDQFNSEPIRKEPKIARNSPCPCGSGKKYKKCCGKTGN